MDWQNLVYILGMSVFYNLGKISMASDKVGADPQHEMYEYQDMSPQHPKLLDPTQTHSHLNIWQKLNCLSLPATHNLLTNTRITTKTSGCYMQHRVIPATLGLCLRHLHLPLIFRNKFLNIHTELQEKAPNNDFVTLFLNAAWNR